MHSKTRRNLWIATTGLLLALVGTVAAGLAVTGISLSQVWEQGDMRRPTELIRYAKQRLLGHDKLEFVLLPILHLVQRHYERPTNGEALPTLGKGQQPADTRQYRPVADVVTRSPAELQAALLKAQPGQIIELAAGTHRFNQKIRIGGAGLTASPITVRGAAAGTTVIQFNAVEGFLVNQPYWVFQDLVIRGVCKADDDCEHAFHIVGKAEHTTVRNNHIEDFNAHIKVNGFNGDWPDHGVLAYNTLTNTRPRATLRSVTPFDLVGASYWKVTDNLVSNFVKGAGNKVSFGIFMKGASEGGRIERNLVVCSRENISGAGVRVGISFGGGGTSPTALCRDGNCAHFEHNGGLVANNIVAHCNDSGLDVNHSSLITLAHNTLINTGGIDLRRAPTQAQAYGNLHEGNVRARDGAVLRVNMDQPVRAPSVFENPDLLILKWRSPPENIPSLRGVPTDFCGQARADGTLPGAFSDISTCAQATEPR